MILLFGSQKGGVGKSTILPNVAYAIREKTNKSIVLVDADKQKNLTQWSQERDETDTKGFVTVQASGNIRKTLLGLAEQYDIVLCDVKGSDSEELRTGMTAADVFISPLQPNQPDLNTLPAVVDIYEAAQSFNEDLKGILFLNRCPTLPSIKEADEARDSIADFPEFILASSWICDRKPYRKAWENGKTIFEIKGSDSIKNGQNEITNLTNEILGVANG